MILINLGLRIREFRNNLEISQEELSFRSGINRNYISDIELGRRNPTVITLEKLAKGLDVEIYDFFKE